MRIRFLSCIILPLLAACSVDGGNTGADSEERGSLGKADLVGHCQLPNGHDFCGHHGAGNCWCDEACVDYGDCCSDAGDACGIEPPPPEGDTCGGLAGLQCSHGEYCRYEPEASCGAGDQTGTCTPRPDICFQLVDPVCGCDGETYTNSCFAARVGVSVDHEGACESQGQSCGGFAGLPCPDGQTCTDDPSDGCDPQNGGADCPGVCVPDDGGDQPECHVAGCSGELCVGPDGPDVSSCIFQPWYTCLQYTSCGNFADAGGCGWEQTPEYVDCLDSFGM